MSEDTFGFMRREQFRDQIMEGKEPIPEDALKWPAVARETTDMMRRSQYAHIEFNLKELWRERGDRYRNSTLSKFQADTPEQKAAVEAIRHYAENIDANIKGCVNLVLVGPAGSGKDMLMATLFNWTWMNGFQLRWTSGAKMASRYRDSFDGGQSERQIDQDYTHPDVLAISDPIPSVGSLTGYQQTALYRVLDYRYSHLQPTWATINAASRQEADTAIGLPLMDRLIHDAVVVKCNWASYRKAKL